MKAVRWRGRRRFPINGGDVALFWIASFPVSIDSFIMTLRSFALEYTVHIRPILVEANAELKRTSIEKLPLNSTRKTEE